MKIRPFQEARMIKIIWIFIVAFLCVMIEITGCNQGIFIPGVLFLCFYLVVCYNILTGAAVATCACLATEIFLGRSTTALPLLVPLVFYAQFWRLAGYRRSLAPQSISGVLIGVVYLTYSIVMPRLSNSETLIPNISAFIVFIGVTSIISALGFPLLLAFLDFCSARIDLSLFQTKRRIDASAHDH